MEHKPRKRLNRCQGPKHKVEGGYICNACYLRLRRENNHPPLPPLQILTTHQPLLPPKNRKHLPQVR